MKRREFLKTAGVGLARVNRGRSTRHRAVDAQLKCAAPRSLPNRSTFSSRVGADLKSVPEATDNKFQIQAFAAVRRPAFAGGRCVTNATVEIATPPPLPSSARIRPRAVIARFRSG